MKKLESIGYSEVNFQEQTTKIIVNEKFAESLSELSEYSEIVIFHYVNEAELRFLKIMFGENVNNYNMAIGKLISIVNNVITIEGIHDLNEIIDITPYYPEYDLQIGDERPEWMEFLFKEIRNRYCLK